MKTVAEVANHPRARLVREVVEILRASGSTTGAEAIWTSLPRQRILWRRLVTYGLTTAESQAMLTRIAFPDYHHAEVEAALAAGNKLKHIHELASGSVAIARDARGIAKPGNKGLRIVQLGLRGANRPTA